MDNSAQHPIGIFDSGLGGLTVAKAIVDFLPHENILYFGDTAHLPYGDKSAATIQQYASKIAQWLLACHCKVILIACNSASAAAYELLAQTIGNDVWVVNVIDPTIRFVCERYDHKHVGLIGTKQTINSGIYVNKLQQKNSTIQCHSLATPLFVPIIEEGFMNHPLLDLALKEYLLRPSLRDITALILGCTHYPLIKHHIAQFYHNSVEIIDSAHIVASTMKQLLEKHHLINQQKCVTREFYASDLTPSFERCAKLFFEQDVQFKKIVL